MRDRDASEIPLDDIVALPRWRGAADRPLRFGVVSDANAMAPRAQGLLHPLLHPKFAVIAGATLVSRIGVWVLDTTWAYTLASGPNGARSVAQAQAETASPTFLLALPARVFADQYDQRRIVILCQLALATAGGTLAVLSHFHLLGAGAIIGIAFFAGCAAALPAPPFQSIVPSLVPADDIRPAVALSSVSFNIARVIGSSIGGVLLATAGAAAIYACNAVALALLTLTCGPMLASAALALAGGSTLIQLATFNAAAQLLLLEAIRGRGLSIYMAATIGCMAVDSPLWGAVLQSLSIDAALGLAAVGSALAAVMERFVPIGLPA